MGKSKYSRTIEVKTASSSYPIYIDKTRYLYDLIKKTTRAQHHLIVTNETVAPLYLEALKRQLSPYTLQECILPDGEVFKNFETVCQIYNDLIENDFHRDGCVIALGGGVIGDMAAFAASSYQRGIDFIQIPTTLLSQVDSSVGGKTGFNYREEKNVIGSFYQPKLVLIDIDYLETLPQREYLAGLAEVIKYALLGDTDFFHWLKAHCKDILSKNKGVLVEMVERCVKMKAEIVLEDEREQGVRALLNLGHTFAHALESMTHYKTWLHGEAVSIGLYCSALMSHKIGLLSEEAVVDVKELIVSFGLPYKIPAHLNSQAIFSYMKRDKKIVNKQIRLILLQSLGQALIATDCTESDIIWVLERVMADKGEGE